MVSYRHFLVLSSVLIHSDTKWQSGDTALVSSDSDVTRLAPSRAPRVLDDEIVGSIGILTESNSGDSVVNGGTATRLNDTTSVGSKTVVLGLNGHSKRYFHDGLLHTINTRWCLDQVVWDLFGGGILSLAGTLRALVCILAIGNGTLGVDGKVGPGRVVESTVATVAAALGVGDAVDELLLGESHQSAIVDVVSTLHGGGGGECPAGAAVSLILDGSNSTLCSPIIRIWSSELWINSELLNLHERLLCLEALRDLEPKQVLVLLICIVRQMIDSDGVSGSGLIMTGNILQGLLELGKSQLKLHLSSIRLTMLANKMQESNLLFFKPLSKEKLTTLLTSMVANSNKSH